MKHFIRSFGLLITVLSSVTGETEEVVYAQVGQQVTLKPFQGTGGQRYMYWHLNDKELAHRNALSGWSPPAEEWRGRVTVSDSGLIITKVEEVDFGSLTLLELNGNTREKVYTWLLTKITVNMKSPSPLLAGERLVLECNTTPTKYRRPEIHWLNPQDGEVGGKQVSVDKATSHDNGQWTCVVKSNDKKSKATISVTVVDLFPASSPHLFTSKSSLLTIPCSLPPYITWDQVRTRGIEEVQWQFSPKLHSADVSKDQKQKLFSLSPGNLTWKVEDSRDLNPVPVEKGNLSLTKRQGKEKDRGDYECIMKFKGEVILRRTARVEVLRIVASPGTNLTSGQQLNLTCSVDSALPSDVQLRLLPPDKSGLTFDRHPSSVTIPAASTKHSGKWRCELWQGGTRLTSEMIQLRIESKLSVWMWVIICSAVVIVFLLLVLVFILYRRKQRRMRHPRHELCRCKHPKPKGFYKT